MVNKPAQWPAVDAGSLRHQIQIESQSSTADSFGQLQQSWNTIRTTAAAIMTASGRELFQQGQLTSEVTHLVTIRWSPTTITPGMRVIFGSRVLRIQAVLNVDERNILARLLCLELSATS